MHLKVRGMRSEGGLAHFIRSQSCIGRFAGCDLKVDWLTAYKVSLALEGAWDVI